MSLNFNGNYIGGVPSGGGEGGTTNHAQLTNLDYANSGHTGFMKNDASNLTTDGQKVFDGQWGFLSTKIANKVACPTSTNDEINISTHLPNDTYTYDVLMSVVVRANSTAVGNQARIEIKSDIMTAFCIAGDVVCATQGSVFSNSTTLTIPVGSERKLIINALDWVKGDYSIWLRGYRRIGTNQ